MSGSKRQGGKEGQHERTWTDQASGGWERQVSGIVLLDEDKDDDATEAAAISPVQAMGSGWASSGPIHGQREDCEVRSWRG
jgi:hypothetical protein